MKCIRLQNNEVLFLSSKTLGMNVILKNLDSVTGNENEPELVQKTFVNWIDDKETAMRAINYGGIKETTEEETAAFNFFCEKSKEWDQFQTQMNDIDHAISNVRFGNGQS
jgi:hypothetical protein